MMAALFVAGLIASVFVVLALVESWLQLIRDESCPDCGGVLRQTRAGVWVCMDEDES